MSAETKETWIWVDPSDDHQLGIVLPCKLHEGRQRKAPGFPHRGMLEGYLCHWKKRLCQYSQSTGCGHIGPTALELPFVMMSRAVMVDFQRLRASKLSVFCGISLRRKGMVGRVSGPKKRPTKLPTHIDTIRMLCLSVLS